MPSSIQKINSARHRPRLQRVLEVDVVLVRQVLVVGLFVSVLVLALLHLALSVLVPVLDLGRARGLVFELVPALVHKAVL